MTGTRPPVDFESADTRAPLLGYRDRRILAHVVVNLEVWAYDQPMPRKLLAGPRGEDHVPDVPNFSWVEYGLRCGLPRIRDALTARDVGASASVNAAIIRDYPAVAELVSSAGWEWVAHGVRQESLPAVDDEAGVIEEAASLIADWTGQRPRGWLGPGLHETSDTPDLLSAAGFSYVCDWGLDDQPTWLEAAPEPLVAVPYQLELNDSLLFAAQAHSIDEYTHRAQRTLERFSREVDAGPRILTLGVHPHLLGVPHRIGGFERVLDLLCEHHDVAFVTGCQVDAWFREATS